MKVAYNFSVNTFRTSSSSVTITTDKALIEFYPDSSQGNQIRGARVTVDGNSSNDAQKVARLELIKVMTVFFGAQATCIMHPVDWSEIPEEGESKKHRIGKAITITSNVRFVAPFTTSSDKTLKVRLNGDANPILQYYDASRRERPQDKYLQMYRIIEYICGQTVKGTKMRDHILNNLGVKWHIPQTALQKAMSIPRLSHIQNERQLASELWDMRGRCAHLQPTYGFLPFDDAGNSEILDDLPIIDEIVRHSLEKHPDTKEP